LRVPQRGVDGGDEVGGIAEGGRIDRDEQGVLAVLAALGVVVEADDADLAGLEDVVGRHLVRFGARTNRSWRDRGTPARAAPPMAARASVGGVTGSSWGGRMGGADGRFSATVANSPRVIGETAVNNTLALLADPTSVARIADIPLSLITGENLDRAPSYCS